MGLALAGIEDPLNSFCSSYEKLARDIREGIEEGFSEGLREGIKQGFVDGIKECRDTGFENIEVTEMEGVLKYALEAASDESARTKIKRTVSNEYWAKISPLFKQKMIEACNRAVEEIKDANFELDKKPPSYIRSCVNASLEKITGFIGDVSGGVREKLPTGMIFGSFFDSLQDELNRDLAKNLETCKERIFEVVDSKTIDERLDYERH